MVLLVPRQVRMTGMTGNVPYYGGRLSPQQAYAASHAAPPQAPPPPPAAPSRKTRDPLAALDALLESAVITRDEYLQLRERLGT